MRRSTCSTARGLHRPRDDAAAPRFPGPEGRVRAHHDEGCRRLRARRRRGAGLLGATITAHHLLYNRNALFVGGIRPHTAAVETRDASRRAGRPRRRATRAFPGHRQRTARARREGNRVRLCGLPALHALELCGSVRHPGALDKLEGFFGADFWGCRAASGPSRCVARRGNCPREIFAAIHPSCRCATTAGSWRKPPRRRTNPAHAACGARARMRVAKQERSRPRRLRARGGEESPDSRAG